jgi:hypothetical protein
VPAPRALEHQQVAPLADHAEERLVAVRRLDTRIVGESFQDAVEVVRGRLGLQGKHVELVEDEKRSRSLYSFVGSRIPACPKKLDIVIGAPTGVATAEVDIDSVNAIVVQDDKLVVAGLRAGAPFPWRMSELNPQIQIFQRCLDEEDTVPFLVYWELNLMRFFALLL